MPNSYYTVPEQFAGRTIRQMFDAGLGGGRGDILASHLGISEDTPFTAGQTFNVSEHPGQGSGERQFLDRNFVAGVSPAQREETSFMDALNARIGGQERLGDMATRMGGELQLPALRQSAFNLTQTLRNIPGVQNTISRQVGISAPNLQKRIAAEQGKIAPLAQDAVSQQQFAEEELGQRLGYGVAEQERELRPFFEAGLPLLQDRLAREHSNYQMERQNELDQILTRIGQGFQATQAELDRANELAMAERNYVNQTNLLRLGTDENIREHRATRNTGAGGSSALNYLTPRSTTTTRPAIGSFWSSAG